MSGLRRSRPDEQDASLRKLQEISVTRHETELGLKSSRLSPRSPSKCHFKNPLEVQQKPEQHFFPPVLMISDLPSSPAVHQFEKIFNPEASYLGGQITPISSDCLTLSPNTKHKSGPCSQGAPVTSSNSGLLTGTSPQSPKNRTISETSFDSGLRLGSQGKPQSSPSSPSLMLKHFKLFSTSGFDTSKRRGSEPILESTTGQDFKKLQLGVTDRRWEKLRSILVAMKDEPIDVDSMLGTLPANPLENIQDKISMQEELTSLSKEVADLKVILRQKESNLHQLELERNAALLYIQQMKFPSPVNEEDDNTAKHHIEQGIQGLKDETVTKEEVIEVTSHLLREVTSQKAYLQRLMALVLTHVPQLLDEVDGLYSASGEGGYDEDDNDEYGDAVEDSFSEHNESDDEVWC